MINHIGYSLRGYYSYEIINASTGEVEKRSKPKNNLILNQGMNYIAVRAFADNFVACAIGVSATAPLLTDTALGNESKRTTTYATGSENCGATLNSNILSIFRTFVFTVETETRQCGEIAWSYDSNSGANLFSKALIVDEGGNPGPIIVQGGRFIQVKYTLEITLTPSSPTVTVPNFAGRTGTDGSASVQLIGLKGIDNNGLTNNFDLGSGANEPSFNANIFISTGTGALASIGSSNDRSVGASGIQTSLTSYVNNSYTISKYGNFGKNIATGDFFRSMGIGPHNASAKNSTYVHLFDSNQSKSGDYVWSIHFNYTWSRT